MLNTTLSTSQDARTSIEYLLLELQSTPIGPKMPSPSEMLHNRTIQYQGRPSVLIDMKAVWNHLIAKKQSQKQYFHKS